MEVSMFCQKNKILDVEKINIGDMGLGYATIIHGFSGKQKIEPDLNDPKDGRWFLMYSNQSDEAKIRHTGYSVTKTELKKSSFIST